MQKNDHNMIFRPWYVSVFYTLSMALALVACSNATDDFIPVSTEEVEEYNSVKVPIFIEMESAWNVDEAGPSYIPPPGAEGGNAGGGGTSIVSDGWVSGDEDATAVDKVRIVAFRRKDTSDGIGTSEPFLYDVKNDQIVDVLGWKDGKTDDYTTTHRHRYAQGTLTKIYGYEYRVVAIAYSSTRKVPYNENDSYNEYLTTGEHNWFVTNETDGLTLENFMATVTTQTTEDSNSGWREYLTGNSSATGATEHISNLTSKVVACPQLFWGFCHLENDNDPVIRFSTTNSSGDLVNDAGLTGLLFRGMAKVELHINLEPRRRGGVDNTVNWICLLADHIYTQVHLSDYDDFLSPSIPIETDGKFTAIDYKANKNENKDGSGRIVLTAWVLPTRTRLAIRGRYIWALAHHVNNGQLCANNISYGDMGTGIISSDVIDNYFYLRRNHKYVLNCSSSENIFNNHEID